MKYFHVINKMFQVVNLRPEEVWSSPEDENFFVKCILCMPILNGQKTLIGVAQLINKVKTVSNIPN